MQRKETWIRLVLVGDREVGKSSLISRFVNDTFNSVMMPTGRVDYFEKKHMEMNGETLIVDIWENPSYSHYESFYIDPWFSSATNFILVYDTTNRKSFDNIEAWMKKAQERKDVACKFILVGTKSDVWDKEVDPDHAKAFAKKYGMQFFETSARGNENINQFFQAFVQEIRKPFVTPAAAPEVKKPKEVKKEIKIDVSNVDDLKELIMLIAKGEKNEDLKQLGKFENLKETVLNYLKGLEEKHSYKDLDDILSKNQTSRKLNEFFKVPRGLVSLSLFGGTIKQFEALESRWLERTKLGVAKDAPIRHVPQRPSAPSGFYDDSSGPDGGAMPSAPYAPSAAPSAPRWPDVKSRPSSAPPATEDFNKRMKDYINGLKGKPTVAQRIAELKLTPEEETAFEKFLEPITEEYIKTPISLHGVTLSLETIEDYRQRRIYTHPTTIDDYTIQEIEPCRKVLDDLDEAIKKLKEDRAKKPSPRRP